MFGTIGLISHLVAAFGFAGLAILLAARQRPSAFRMSVSLASLFTAFWAAGQALVAGHGLGDAAWLSMAETARTAAWIGVLVVLQRHSWGLDDRPSSSFLVAVLLGFTIALQLMLDLLTGAGVAAQRGDGSTAALLWVTLRLVVAISGLVLLHNLYINARESESLHFRMFAVALGLLFAYDLNLYTLQFLLGHPNDTLIELRGAVNVLAVPLLFLSVRTEADEGHFQLSRQVAFHTVSFSMIGLYLIVMSMIAYGLKLTGGSWGDLLQVGFLAIALVIGALVFLSPRFRAQLKVRIARNFYRYRYDYRAEWLRFIDTVDGGGGGDMPIRERVVKAIAAVLDCPGGALFEPVEGGGFELSGRWRWASLGAVRIAEGAALPQYLAESARVVDFDELRRREESPGLFPERVDLALPDWARLDPSIWLALPLIHRQQLTGILLLERSLAPRDLNWEDFDLLRTLGSQGASYLAEAATQARLDEARAFEEYNRRFAFVMHDLKNVVSQLGLLARNAGRHADKPEFREDMVATLRSSVSKMTDLMALLGRETDARGVAPAADAHTVDLARLLSVVVVQARRQHAAIELEGAEAAVLVAGDEGRLEAMFTHLVQNAIDASAPDAAILVRLAAANGQVQIDIRDRGHGMTRAFIRDELFRPFRSTKSGGFGIGAYEAREIARAHRGRLDVSSRPGEGSCFTISLPIAQPAAAVGADARP